MKDKLNKFTLRSVLISLCFIALGVIILMEDKTVLFWVIKVLGVILLIDALIRFIQFIRLDSDEKSINFDIIRAVIEAVIGIVSLVNSSSMETTLYIFVGVIVIVEGILHLQFVLTRKKNVNYWLICFFIAVINILCGVFIIAHPLIITESVSVIIGIEIIVTSVLSLLSYIYLFINLKKAAKAQKDNYDDDYE